MRYIVEYSRASMNERDEENRNILHYAAASGKLPVVRYLTERVGMDPLAGDVHLVTPFDVAVKMGHKEVAGYFEEICQAPSTDMYRNPVRTGMFPDPSIVRVGEDYYMVNSSFIYFPCIPVSLSLIHIFRYAFYEYKGIKEPLFVGFRKFQKMFSMPGFWQAFANTLKLSVVKLLLNTGMAVFISILLNEVVRLRFKKVAQTVIYLPHFMSWVVTASVFALILSPTPSGLVNSVLTSFGLIEKGNEIYFLGDKKWWTPVFYMINVWKDTGWGTKMCIRDRYRFDLHVSPCPADCQ